MTEFVSKGWGFELIIANSELYCGKLLYVVKGRHCSTHFHLKKDETFFCAKGVLKVEWVTPHEWKIPYKDGKPLQEYKECWEFPIFKHEWQMQAGDHLHLPPRTIHKFTAIQTTELFEFSTQHFDEDSHRIIPGN